MCTLRTVLGLGARVLILPPEPQVMAEMSQLASGITKTKLEQDEMEGVDEDEWGDEDEDED